MSLDIEQGDEVIVPFFTYVVDLPIHTEMDMDTRNFIISICNFLKQQINERKTLLRT